MLYLEKSSLEHLDMKTGQWRDALKWVPGKVPTLPGRVSAPGPHPTAPPPSGTSGLARAIESPALPRVRLSLASAEMLHLSPSEGGGRAGATFPTFDCSQQEKRDCPEAHHLR